MRKWFILMAALVLLIPSPVRAQGTVALKSFHVQLWSEYDQPSMLVILDFALTDDSQTSSPIGISIPSDANLTAVAFDSGGSLMLANYQVKPGEDANWQVIELLITEPTTYHIEYYQPLTRDGDKRSFTYRWTGKYAVSDFGVEIQIPGDSTGVKSTPAIPFVQNQSFTGGGANMTGLKEGQTYQLQLEYSRTSEVTSQQPSSSPVEPVVPVDENTDGRSTLNNLPLLLGGLGAALIIGALVYLMRDRFSMETSKPRRRRSSANAAGSQVYCHECGTRAHESDRFCRTCGSKLRAS